MKTSKTLPKKWVVPWLLALTVGMAAAGSNAQADNPNDHLIVQNSMRQLMTGRNTFRFDTFGDSAFWSGTLKLHDAIAGEKLGGVGSGVSPATALAVGLKVEWMPYHPTC